MKIAEQQLAFDLPSPPPKLRQLWTPDDIYRHIDEMTVSRFAEDSRVERKIASVQAREIGEYLSMWSNTPPEGGLIFVGVEDGGVISGCVRVGQTHRNSLEDTIVFCPDARPIIKSVKVKNKNGEDDFILVFRVPYIDNKLVETTDGKAFYRKGSNKRKMNEIMKQEQRILKGEVHHELGLVPLAYPDNFDLDQVEKFCAAYTISKRVNQRRSNEEILELARLGKRTKDGFKPNLAGCLVLARDPRQVIPGFYIRIIRYEGSNESTGERHNSIFNEIVDGPVSRLIYDAKERISSQIKLFQRLNSSGRLERKPEYPEAAWLEALVNAIAHRSYVFKTQPIVVKLFNDRLEVESPGSFMYPVTAETIYDAHAPRNPFLIEAMWHLGFTFMNREGTTRMRDEMLAANLPKPKFSQGDSSHHRVTVILENDVKTRGGVSEEFAGLPEDVYASLANEEKAIVIYLSTSSGITITQAAALIERSSPTATKHLNALVQKNILSPFIEGKSVDVRPRVYSLKKST